MSLLTICGVVGSLIHGRVEYLKGPLEVSLYCKQSQSQGLFRVATWHMCASPHLVHKQFMGAILYGSVIILHQFQVRNGKGLCSA